MTSLQTKLLAVSVLAGLGAGIFEAHEAARLRDDLQTLRQQQVTLTAQSQEWMRKQADSTNRLNELLAENERLKSTPEVSELLRLRGELARLKATGVQSEAAPNESVLNPWLERVGQFKQYLAQHPDKNIPEFRYLTDRDWLIVMAFETQAIDFGAAVDSLKWMGISRFANEVSAVLQRYALANQGQFPTDLSQLQPCCDSAVESILQQRYEIRPGSVLPASAVRDLNIQTDWVIVGRDPIGANSGNRLAIYSKGNTLFW